MSDSLIDEALAVVTRELDFAYALDGDLDPGIDERIVHALARDGLLATHGVAGEGAVRALRPPLRHHHRPEGQMTPADRPPVTDNARAEAERRYPSDVADRGVTYPTGAVREHSQAAFVAGAEWAAGRAETTTDPVGDAYMLGYSAARTKETTAPTREDLVVAIGHNGEWCRGDEKRDGSCCDAGSIAEAVLALLKGGTNE